MEYLSMRHYLKINLFGTFLPLRSTAPYSRSSAACPAIVLVDHLVSRSTGRVSLVHRQFSWYTIEFSSRVALLLVDRAPCLYFLTSFWTHSLWSLVLSRLGSLSFSSQSLSYMTMMNRASKRPASLVDPLPNPALMFSSTTTKLKYENIFKIVPDNHDWYVKRVPEILYCFTPLINFAWESFLFIAEDVCEHAVHLFHANLSGHNGFHRWRNPFKIFCFRCTYWVFSLYPLWHSNLLNERECTYVPSSDIFEKFSHSETQVDSTILNACISGQEIKNVHLKPDLHVIFQILLLATSFRVVAIMIMWAAYKPFSPWPQSWLEIKPMAYHIWNHACNQFQIWPICLLF